MVTHVSLGYHVVYHHNVHRLVLRLVSHSQNLCHRALIHYALIISTSMVHDIYSRTSIIRTPVCHLNVKGVQINEFVRISELSDKIQYLADGGKF